MCRFFSLFIYSSVSQKLYYGKLVSVLLTLLLQDLACTLVLHNFHSMILRQGVGEIGEDEMFMSF